ncbi:hypothetical protein HPB47_020907 [Ixodes persulcatus]|uniref:Uncharacterized protein n=1 Tax=Ixodes persulcatus TaxID=34615 RepID=A0AC60QE12_IXOPE|nr:hypothetical protein HPB47_020907 [Ixodes persulcatus]
MCDQRYSEKTWMKSVRGHKSTRRERPKPVIEEGNFAQFTAVALHRVIELAAIATNPYHSWLDDLLSPKRPKGFARLRDKDVEDWLNSYDRLSLKDIFGTPTSRKENAKKKLETRRQEEETYTSYIEDVLELCRRVCEMQESERVRNLLKGISEPAFNVFLLTPHLFVNTSMKCGPSESLAQLRISENQKRQILNSAPS